MSTLVTLLVSVAYLVVGILAAAINRAYIGGRSTGDVEIIFTILFWPLWLAIAIVVAPFSAAVTLTEWLAEKLPK